MALRTVTQRVLHTLGCKDSARAMQLLVRKLSGRTTVLEADPRETVAALKARGYFAFGAPAHALRLTSAGRELDDTRTLADYGLAELSTLHVALRLRGGAPTHVKLVTKRSPVDFAVIDVDESDSVDVVKRKLQAATGIPASNMKIRLGGYNQFVMIDTTSNIRVGSSGITSAIHEVDTGIVQPESFK